MENYNNAGKICKARGLEKLFIVFTNTGKIIKHEFSYYQNTQHGKLEWKMHISA